MSDSSLSWILEARSVDHVTNCCHEDHIVKRNLIYLLKPGFLAPAIANLYTVLIDALLSDYMLIG